MKKALLIGSFLAGLLLLTVSLAPPTSAIDIFSGACGDAGSNAVCEARSDSFPTLMRNIVSTMFILIGMVGVIMVIVGGFRYVTSNGDPSGTAAAKNTIIYAVVGIVVAVASFGIVNFVLTRFGVGL